MLIPTQVLFGDCAQQASLSFNSETYNLVQIHIHSPSEHAVRKQIDVGESVLRTEKYAPRVALTKCTGGRAMSPKHRSCCALEVVSPDFHIPTTQHPLSHDDGFTLLFSLRLSSMADWRLPSRG